MNKKILSLLCRIERVVFGWTGFVLMAFGCSGTGPDVSISKEDVRETGKTDWQIDYCEEYGWYDDDVCDTFCPRPDPQCSLEGEECGDSVGPLCAESLYCCGLDDDVHREAAGVTGICRPIGYCETVDDCFAHGNEWGHEDVGHAACACVGNTCTLKEFMITFDDGPLPGKTDKIVDALREFYVDGEPVRAGFFMVGSNDPEYHAWYEIWSDKGSVKDYPQLTRFVAEAGHLVGNHTQHHAWFEWWTPSEYSVVKLEISECDSEIAAALAPIGKTPPKIFRPPYMFDSQGMRDAAAELGFHIIWGELVGDVTPFVSAASVKENALEKLENWKEDEPCVLIFHDNRPATYNHIADIIHYLQDRGFKLAHFDPSRLPP